MTPTIKTQRLTLRPARWEDLGALHEILCRPDATRYWSSPAHVDLETTKAWLDSMINNEFETGCDFIVECDGHVIGKAGMWRASEIGFIIHPNYWGRGLASEATFAAIKAVFERTKTDPITADVDPRNVASLAILKRCGFTITHTQANTVQHGNEWCDSVYLVLKRAAFLALGIS